MYGTDWHFRFDASFSDFVNKNYRPNLQNPTLDELLTRVASDNALDYYVKADFTNASSFGEDIPKILVTIYGIYRKFQDDVLREDEIFQFINDRDGRVKDKEIGRELRLDPNSHTFWGDRVRTQYLPENKYPIYNKFGDGSYTDRIFISLEGIESQDTNLIENLPEVDFEKKVLETSFDPIIQGFVPIPKYKKKRPQANDRVHKRKGYMATEGILRAALRNKEAWITAVYYLAVDAQKTFIVELEDAFETALRVLYSALGVPFLFGGTYEKPANFATNLGIDAPCWGS
jgi:hypothetical protein